MFVPPKMPKKQTYKKMMADILKSKTKTSEADKIKKVTGGGTAKKAIKI